MMREELSLQEKLEYRNIGKGGEPDVRIYCDQSVGNEI